MKTREDMTDNVLWRDKAVAFAARSRQELWGKHNEDILAWFFLNGFKNRFIKDKLLGWNRRPKERPSEAWGFPEGTGPLFFPPGIVIPFVEEKHLRKLVIFDHSRIGGPCHVVPGSAGIPMVFGQDTRRTAVVENIIHGLLLHQEFPENLRVVVPDDPTQVSTVSEIILEDGPSEVLYFPDPLNERSSHPSFETRTYERPAELLDMIRSWVS